jgi:hypothetical protein
MRLGRILKAGIHRTPLLLHQPDGIPSANRGIPKERYQPGLPVLLRGYKTERILRAGFHRTPLLLNQPYGIPSENREIPK